LTGILEFLKRDAQQKEQMRIWTQEQIYEKERIKQLLKAEKEYDFKCIYFKLSSSRKYDNFQLSINDKLNALNHAVETAKREQAKQDTEYNAALVRNQRVWLTHNLLAC
jgi:hypothetical protein